MTTQTPDVKALADRLEHHSLYVGLAGHTNNAFTSNLLAEAVTALRAAPDAGKCDDPLCPETSCDLCSTPSAPEASGAEPVAWPKEEIEPGRFVDVDPSVMTNDELKRYASPPPADMRGTEGEPISKTLRTWAKAYRDTPKCRFPSDPNAEFFPQDLEFAASELDRLELFYQSTPLATPPVADAGIVAPPVDGHEYTGEFTANEFLKRADEHEKAARNGMAAGPNTSYTRTFQACAAALRFAAEHMFVAPPASADADRKALIERVASMRQHEICPEARDELLNFIIGKRALTAPVAGADASPSAMRERAAQVIDDKISALEKLQSFQSNSRLHDEIGAVVCHLASAANCIRALSPDAGVGMPSTDTPS